jgi:hypothetical protein
MTTSSYTLRKRLVYQMASTITIAPDDLSEYIAKIFDEYGDKADKIIENAGKEVSKAAVKMIKASSPQRRNSQKHYKDGWTYQLAKELMSFEVTIYNKSKPGLTHLLEHGHAIVFYGHAKASGGRTKAIPHIAPAQEWAVSEFIKVITNELKAK